LRLLQSLVAQGGVGSSLLAAAAEGWALGFGGPTKIDRDLHDLPHCSFEHGCHSLPFADDTDYMASSHGAKIWLETLLMLSFVPAAALCIYLLVDIITRLSCRCCCRGRNARRREGCCGSCVDDCSGGAGADEEEEERSFQSPAARLASGGGGHYGSASDYPASSVLSQSRVVSHAVARRGGTAGQTSDAFTLLHDPNNPFSTSSRLLPGASQESESVETRYTSTAVVTGNPAEPRDPDRNWKCRMITATLLTMLALAALAHSLSYVSRGHSSLNDVRGGLAEAQDYFSVLLHDESVGAVTADITATQAALLAVEQAALNLSRPLSEDQATLVRATAANYGLVNSELFAPFQERLANESRHGDDVRRYVGDAESIRQWVSYWLFGALIAFSITLLLVHAFTRRRGCLSLSCNVWLALLLIPSLLLAAAGLTFSVGIADACMAPVSYLRSALNSTALLPHDSTPFRREEVATLDFYIQCPQEPDPFSPANAPLPSWPANPLNSEYLSPALQALRSEYVGGGLEDVQDFIRNNRTDLMPEGLVLAARNATTWADVAALQQRLGCVAVHDVLMRTLGSVCGGTVENLWLAACLQFGACILLLLVRCLVRMRRGGAPPRNTLGRYDADDDAAAAALSRSGVVGASSEPFLVHADEGKEAHEAAINMGAEGAVNTSYAARAHNHSVTNIRTSAKY